MKLTDLLNDRDAVSPVIGVILMVAITVILAAVIGTFVLGLGDQVQDNAPQASFTFDYEAGGSTGTCEFAAGGLDGDLTITHDGGDKIEGANLDVTGNATAAWDEPGAAASATNCDGATDVTAGDSVTGQVADDLTYRVTWQAGGENSATLGKWTAPEA